MITNDWRAGTLADQPSVSRTLGLRCPSPEAIQDFNQQLREVLDKLYWRVLQLEEEIKAIKSAV